MYGAFQELSIKRGIPSSTNKVPLDSTLGLPRTLLLVTIWYTCQRANSAQDRSSASPRLVANSLLAQRRPTKKLKDALSTKTQAKRKVAWK
ncbi:hypothetical protein GmHk_20G058467 [Glycine max]|nr:hypothetical protein GmHk_20G058467 [Glycine max]